MLGSSPSAASCHHALRALSAGDTGLMTCHQDPRPTEVPLPAGRMTSGIVRRGDRLLRPMGPWSPAVHEYLRHLEAAGFEGSPRVLGIEGDRHGVTVAFIDWDAAQPVDPLADLASAAWAFVPLAPARQLAEAGFDPLPDLPARLRLFLDAYGLTDRKAIMAALRHCALDEPEPLRWFQGTSADLARAL